mmetsp:Transcript_14591/g.36295  ORF Transcript_14591/g.36295 Transcript_14591/m.36295 type:complete len:668 (+) Transcript_14591:168-2171(+)
MTHAHTTNISLLSSIVNQALGSAGKLASWSRSWLAGDEEQQSSGTGFFDLPENALVHLLASIEKTKFGSYTALKGLLGACRFTRSLVLDHIPEITLWPNPGADDGAELQHQAWLHRAARRSTGPLSLRIDFQSCGRPQGQTLERLLLQALEQGQQQAVAAPVQASNTATGVVQARAGSEALSAQGNEHMAPIKGWPAVQRLEIMNDGNDDPMPTASWGHLLGACMPSLRLLLLRFMRVQGLGLWHGLQSCPHLTHMRLDNVQLDESAQRQVQVLAAALPSLTSVDLVNVQGDAAVITALGPQLTQLSYSPQVAGTLVTDMCAALACCTRLTSITLRNMYDARIDDVWMGVLLGLPALRHVEFDGYWSLALTQPHSHRGYPAAEAGSRRSSDLTPSRVSSRAASGSGSAAVGGWQTLRLSRVSASALALLPLSGVGELAVRQLVLHVGTDAAAAQQLARDAAAALARPHTMVWEKGVPCIEVMETKGGQQQVLHQQQGAGQAAPVGAASQRAAAAPDAAAHRNAVCTALASLSDLTPGATQLQLIWHHAPGEGLTAEIGAGEVQALGHALGSSLRQLRLHITGSIAPGFWSSLPVELPSLHTLALRGLDSISKESLAALSALCMSSARHMRVVMPCDPKHVREGVAKVQGAAKAKGSKVVLELARAWE